MQEHKHWFPISIIVLVVAIIVALGFMFAQKINFSNLNTSQKTATTPAVVDAGAEIPAQLPVGLVQSSDIKQVLQSYTASDVQGIHQYTFRYISKKSLVLNGSYFANYLSKNGWHITSSILDSKAFASIVSIKNNEKILVTVNNSSVTGVSVDITYIK